MLKALTITHLYVTDHEEALDFYVGKLGLEVNADVPLDFMRWLTINVPGHPDPQLLLEVPGPPSHDPETAEQVRALVAKGAIGMAIFTTDDCRAAYEALRAQGVEFTEEPTERPYGIDCALRDPFGNHLRIGQMAPVAASENAPA
jgi:catechol 2,3-dioxygenase-like lactoylglutathione lyase family enzyme